MASRNDMRDEQAFSLIEVLIGLSILLIAGAMVSRNFVSSHKASQEIDGKNISQQELMNTLQKIRRSITMRDSKQAITSQPNALTLQIPLSSTSKTNYRLTLTSRCRPLPAGETLDLSVAKLGKACLQSLNCANGIPYVEWRYVGHPSLTMQQQPEPQKFQTELKKTFGAAGLGLCVTQTADSLAVEAVMVHLKKEGQNRLAELASESLMIPIGKRNNIEIIP